jgi:uncharacterized protein (UPF0305 family)
MITIEVEDEEEEEEEDEDGEEASDEASRVLRRSTRLNRRYISPLFLYLLLFLINVFFVKGAPLHPL